MKESIGGTWLFGIVILFILLFTAIMCFTINQSKAFAVKSDIIDYIEHDGGLAINGDKVDAGIVEIIKSAGYFTAGSCEEGYSGFNRQGMKSSVNPVICIREIAANSETQGCYYEIVVFYRLDLPVIESAFNFKVKGKTRELYNKCNT